MLSLPHNMSPLWRLCYAITAGDVSAGIAADCVDPSVWLEKTPHDPRPFPDRPLRPCPKNYAAAKVEREQQTLKYYPSKLWHFRIWNIDGQAGNRKYMAGPYMVQRRSASHLTQIDHAPSNFIAFVLHSGNAVLQQSDTRRSWR